MKASMDGNDIVELVSDLGWPRGITVDYESSTLFWVDWSRGKVQSSSLDGGVISTLASTERPWGIAVDENRVYFSTSPLGQRSALKRCAKTGGEVKTLYKAGAYGSIQHLTLMTSKSRSTTRQNHCASQTCSGDGICVLTPSSFRCIHS